MYDSSLGRNDSPLLVNVFTPVWVNLSPLLEHDLPLWLQMIYPCDYTYMILPLDIYMQLLQYIYEFYAYFSYSIWTFVT
jgi:hypothetical protein